jgi:hypothetical protein
MSAAISLERNASSSSAALRESGVAVAELARQIGAEVLITSPPSRVYLMLNSYVTGQTLVLDGGGLVV